MICIANLLILCCYIIFQFSYLWNWWKSYLSKFFFHENLSHSARWSRVVWWKFTDISEEVTASIFEESKFLPFLIHCFLCAYSASVFPQSCNTTVLICYSNYNASELCFSILWYNVTLRRAIVFFWDFRNHKAQGEIHL